MAEIDPYDPIFVSRGIDPEAVLDQGYVRWTEEDYIAVIEESFAGMSENQSGSLDWLIKMASQGPGIVIDRQSPFADSFEGGTGFLPEIRPDRAVQTGHAQRHFHAELGDDGLWGLLPRDVIQAFCIPQLGGWRVMKFQHSHDSFEGNEDAEHQGVWHSAAPRQRVHWHSLKVFPPTSVKDHILSDSGKITYPHCGKNDLGIHQHAPLAKYLFAPSMSVDESWNENSRHDHARMNESELEWHLTHVDHSDHMVEEEQA